MRLNRIPSFTECPRLNYGGTWSRASRIPYRATGRVVFACLVLLFAEQAIAQQANQPSFDPRQTEKHFDDPQSGEGQPAGPALRRPTFARPEIVADGKTIHIYGASTKGNTILQYAELDSRL